MPSQGSLFTSSGRDTGQVFAGVSWGRRSLSRAARGGPSLRVSFCPMGPALPAGPPAGHGALRGLGPHAGSGGHPWQASSQLSASGGRLHWLAWSAEHRKPCSSPLPFACQGRRHATPGTRSAFCRSLPNGVTFATCSWKSSLEQTRKYLPKP